MKRRALIWSIWLASLSAMALAQDEGSRPKGPPHLIDPLPPKHSCVQPPPGMTAWWPLNETYGAKTIADIVGGHNGTSLSGAVGPANSGGPVAIAGQVGGALNFSKYTTFVEVPNAPSLNFGKGNFTIDAWINPLVLSNNTYSPIVDKVPPANTPPSPHQGYRLYVKSGMVIFEVADGNTAASVSAPVAAGQWQFVAAQRLGNKINLYVSGVLATTVLPPGFGSVNNTAKLLVGGIYGGVGGVPPGPSIGEIILDEVEIFNRALTPQEINAIYMAGKAGKCKTQEIDLGISKKLKDGLVAGQQATYEITVNNVGTTAVPNGATIVVTDTLPPNVIYVSASGSGWSCSVSVSGSTLTCSHLGPLNPGGSLPPISLTVKVLDDAKEVENCAQVKALQWTGDMSPAKLTKPDPIKIGIGNIKELPDANPQNNLGCNVSPVKKCQTVTLLGGKKDDFSVADGVTAEPATPVPGPSAWANSFFDQTTYNKAFAHRFAKKIPDRMCVCEAKLGVRLKPLGEQFTNDKIYLYAPFIPGTTPAWSASLLALTTTNPPANPPGWTAGTPVTLTLNLAALPPGGTGPTNLLPAIQASGGVLDLVIQDDTSVDYAELTVKVCPCPCPNGNTIGSVDSPETAIQREEMMKEPPMIPHHPSSSSFGGVENPEGVIQPEEMMKEMPMIPHRPSPFGGVENPGGVIQPEGMMKEIPMIYKNPHR